MSRVEEFTFEDGSKTHSVNGRSRTALQEFSDQVLAAVADRYPGMVARVEHLRPPKASRQAESHGPEQPKWRDLDQYRMALDNTQTILTALSHASVAQNLQTMTTVGMPVTLKEQGRFRTHHRQVWLSAELTDRQYKGTTAHGERWIRNYLGGAQQMGQESSTSRAFQGALDLYLSVRDAALSAITKSPNNTGTAQFGARLTRRTGRSTATGATLYNEPMGSPRGPAHLHSYKLSLTAHAGGYGRIRGVLRFLSLGALGTRPLISREPQAELVGGETGEPFTARVLLAVPAAHSPDHASQTAGAVAAREWMTPASNTRGAIRTESMSTSEARALADGTVDALVQPGEHERLQLEPVQTVAVLSDEVLPEAAERIMGRASGGAQSLTQHGFPAHDSMLRSFHPTYWAAHFDQNSAPLGSHVSGLHGRGPYQDNHAAMVVRTRLENPVVLGDAVQIYNEQTIAADVELSASRSNTSQISFGGVGTFGHFDDLGRTVTGSYSGLFRHITAQSFSRAVSRTVNQASTMNWDNYHQFLIGADVRVDMAAKAKWTAAFGLLGSHLLGGNAPVGQRLVLPAGYLGHVPEPSAYRLGLVQDGLPAAPEFKERAWVLPPWLRDNIFGSHPINALDTSELQTEILPQLRRLGFDEADLALVRTALTPRATRALLTEMSGVGVTVTARGSVMHQWGVTIGGRELSVRLELIPGEQRLKQLQHAIDLEDYRNVTQTTAMSRARSRRLDVGFGTSQAVSIEQDNVGSDGPILNTSGYSSQQLAESNVETRTTFAFVFGYRGHAEYAIDYRMKLTVEAGDAERLAHADRKVGSLRQVLPLSLASPVTTGVHKLLQAPRPPLPEARQLVWPIPRMTDEEVTRWRRGGSPDSDSEPPVLTDLTFQVRWIAGLANIHDAGVLAIGGAYSSRRRASGELSGRQLEGALREARGTALTRQGTMAAQALTNGVGGAALAGFYRDTLAPEGYEVPGLATEDFIGGANADYRLFSRPDFKTATLLTVDPKALLWSIDQVGHQTRTGLTSTSGDETVLSTSPVILNDALGAAVPSLGDLPLAEMSASEARTNAYLEIERRGMWPEQSRLMLFWIPTRWLSIAGVHHLVSDSALGKRVRGTFGDITTAPVAAETDAPVVAWVDEHKARELGLINDENFPAELGRTWDEAAKATEGWIAAAHAYWDARRPVRHLQAELDAAQAAHDEMLPAEAAEAEAEHAPETDTPPAQLAEAAERLRRARDAYDTAAAAVADHWQAADDAVAELHRVRAAADQLTRWYQLPPARRAEVDRPEDVTYQAPEQQSAPERPTYTVVPADGEAPARLVAPTDETYLLHDVPPRDSFLNALAEGMRHNDPDWVNGLLVDGRGTRSELLDALRGRLVDGISSPANADLAEFIAADEADRFTPEELAQAGIDLGEDTPARREFDALGVMPQVQDLSAEQRAALAEAQLRRADGAGLDSAVADLLPALAARELQLNITVVQADGSFQEFQPHVGADQVPTVVLYLADRHFQLVLAEGSEPGTGLAALPESAPPHKAVTETPGQRPAHTVAPWWSGGEEGRYDTRDHERLTAPDGSVYELQPATGAGNGFFGALSRTLEDTSRARLEHAQQPDDYGTPWLQRAAELDPAAGFHRRDLEAAGVRLTDELWAVHHRNGGRLPEGVKLSDQQRRSLVTSHMLGADGWSATTTERTALQFARWLKIELTLVAENGTVEFSTDGRTPGSDSRSVVLYRRGRDWVAAVPTLAVVAHAHPPLESSAGSVGPGIVSQQPVAAPTMALPRVTERQDTARPQPTVAEPRPAEPQVRASQDQVTTTPPSVVASAAYFGVAPRPETAAPVVDDADLLLHPRPLGGALGRFRQPDLTDVGTQSAEQPVEQAVESTVPKDAVGTGEPQASPMAVQPRSYGAASPQDGVAAQAQAPLTQASVGHSIAAYRAVTQDSEVRRLLDEVAPLVYRVRFTGPGAVETAPRTAAWPPRDERPEQGGHTIQAGDGYEISLGRVTHAQDQIATLVHELVHVSVFRQYGRDKNLSANVASDPVVLSRFETYVRMRVVELVNRLPESGLPAGWRLAAQQKLTGHVGMNATLEYDGVLAQLLIWSDQYGDRRSAFHQQLVNLVGETRGWRAAGQVQVPQLPQGSTAHGVERDLMAAASAPVVPSWRLTIPFAEEVRDTVEAGPRAGITALAQDVARTAVSHARHGLPMPAVTVTGMGNGKRYAVPSRAAKAEAAGKDRAAVVAREFRADLADALRANPLGDGSLLDAALVPVTEATVGRNLPADGRNLSAAQLRQLRRQAVIDVTEQPPAVQGAGGAGPVLAGLGAAGPSSEEGTEASASSGQVLRDRTVSAGEEAGSLVTDPAPAESWIHRRADARPGRLTTERFDPATDAAERADAAAARGTWDDVLRQIRAQNPAVQVNSEIRRVQAANGQWVRDFTAVLTVELPAGFTETDLAAYQVRLQGALDEYVNHGYALPRSRDQLHVGVELTPVAENGMVRLTDSGEPRAYQGLWDLGHDLRRIVHEVLHWAVGLHDEYVTETSLFRRDADAPWVRDQGIMASMRPEAAVVFPARYLAEIENVSDSGPVLYDLPLRSGPQRVVTGKPPLLIPGPAAANLNEAMPPASPLSPRSSRSVDPADVAGQRPAAALAMSQQMVPGGRDLELARQLLSGDHATVSEGLRAERQRVEAELSNTMRGLPQGEGEPYLAMLRSRLQRVSQDLEIFGSLSARGIWGDPNQTPPRPSALREAHVTAIVLAERRGRQVAASERRALIDRLRGGRWAWASEYPLGDDEIGPLLDRVHEHVRHRMDVTINMRLDKEIAPGRTVLDSMLEDQGRLFRSAWEAGEQNRGYEARRGATEERMGYAAALNRDRRAGGVFQSLDPDPARDRFAPTSASRTDLPKYAALMSPHRTRALAAYGPSIFHWNPAVRERATFTPQDSFAGGRAGVRGITGADHLFPLLLHGQEDVVRLAFAEATGFAHDAGMRDLRDRGNLSTMAGGYFEAQIHGDLSWSDLERIVLMYETFEKEKFEDIKTRLEEFAAAQGYGFQVEMRRRPIPGRPAPVVEALPVAATGTHGVLSADVHETYPEIELVTSLLDEAGNFPPGLLGESAEAVEAAQAPVAKGGSKGKGKQRDPERLADDADAVIRASLGDAREELDRAEEALTAAERELMRLDNHYGNRDGAVDSAGEPAALSAARAVAEVEEAVREAAEARVRELETQLELHSQAVTQQSTPTPLVVPAAPVTTTTATAAVPLAEESLLEVPALADVAYAHPHHAPSNRRAFTQRGTRAVPGSASAEVSDAEPLGEPVSSSLGEPATATPEQTHQHGEEHGSSASNKASVEAPRADWQPPAQWRLPLQPLNSQRQFPFEELLTAHLSSEEARGLFNDLGTAGSTVAESADGRLQELGRLVAADIAERINAAGLLIAHTELRLELTDPLNAGVLATLTQVVANSLNHRMLMVLAPGTTVEVCPSLRLPAS
jgi:hypothetical protein